MLPVDIRDDDGRILALDATLTSFVFELTGTTEEIDRFVRLMTVIGLVETCRTGISAMGRGAEPL